jgi:RsiW-degrading membrane proteinase PrsW (M82 family)
MFTTILTFITYLTQLTNLFLSAFAPGINWWLIVVAVIIGIVFGAVWLTFFRPPLFKKPWLWIVIAVSAILTWTAAAFIQGPLQYWADQALLHFWDKNTLHQWILLAGIPEILLSGIVQEAAKIAPVIYYWRRDKKTFTPKFALIVGAVSGAGFGVFEAVWKLNMSFAAGYNWLTFAVNGLWSGLGSVVFHTSSTAFVGYGLAKRKGWQYYIIAAILHGLANYSLITSLNSVQQLIWVSVVTIVIAFAVMQLLRHEQKAKTDENPPFVLSDTISQPPVS